MAFAPVEERLKAFVISWAVHYAKLSGRDGKPWLTMPVPLTRSNRCLLANASSVSTDTYLKTVERQQCLDSKWRFRLLSNLFPRRDL